MGDIRKVVLHYCHHAHLVLALNSKNRWEFQFHLLDLQSVYVCDERGTAV